MITSGVYPARAAAKPSRPAQIGDAPAPNWAYRPRRGPAWPLLTVGGQEVAGRRGQVEGVPPGDAEGIPDRHRLLRGLLLRLLLVENGTQGELAVVADDPDGAWLGDRALKAVTPSA